MGEVNPSLFQQQQPEKDNDDLLDHSNRLVDAHGGPLHLDSLHICLEEVLRSLPAVLQLLLLGAVVLDEGQILDTLGQITGQHANALENAGLGAVVPTADEHHLQIPQGQRDQDGQHQQKVVFANGQDCRNQVVKTGKDADHPADQQTHGLLQIVGDRRGQCRGSMAVVVVHPDPGHAAPNLGAGIANRQAAHKAQNKQFQRNNDAIGDVVEQGVPQRLVLQAAGHQGCCGSWQRQQDMVISQLHDERHGDHPPGQVDLPQHPEEAAPVSAARGGFLLHGLSPCSLSESGNVYWTLPPIVWE